MRDLSAVPAGGSAHLGLDTVTPWRVVVDLNQACNLRCTYCHIDATYLPVAGRGPEMEIQHFHRLAQECDEMKVFDLTLTGGEVTTMRNLSDYLCVVPRLKFTSVQIISNGTLLTPRICNMLRDAGIARLSISMDGFQDANDVYRGVGTYKAARRGLENALAAGLTVNIITVLSDRNALAWPQFARFLASLGVQSMNLSLMCRLGRAESDEVWHGVPQSVLPILRREVDEISAELAAHDFHLSLNDGVLRPPGWTGEPTPIHMLQDANPGIELVVKVTGAILLNRLFGNNRVIGDIRSRSLSECWVDTRTLRHSILEQVCSRESLPDRYYHYQGGQDDAPEPDYVALCASMRGTMRTLPLSRLRFRQETWGSPGFDRETFCVGDYIAESESDPRAAVCS